MVMGGAGGRTRPEGRSPGAGGPGRPAWEVRGVVAHGNRGEKERGAVGGKGMNGVPRYRTGQG